MTELPVIDIGPLLDAEVGLEVAAAVDALDRACTDIGFFAVIGHQIDPALSMAVFAAAETFFSWPTDRKEAIAIGRSANHTGYVALEAERLQPDLLGDLKEAIDIALEPAALSADCTIGAESTISQLPPIEGLAAAVVAYQRQGLRAAAGVLRGLALALDLPPRFFAERMRRPACFLRMLRYPPTQSAAETVQLGCGAHTDYGLITLLAVDGVSGLEVCGRDGSWTPVSAPHGALVVNLGDLLARWTNERYVSTPHRVRAVPQDRCSMPFFVNPDADVLVEAIPSCVPVGQQPRWPPVVAGAYLHERFAATHEYLQQ